MIKVKCYYDKEKVMKITRSTQIKSLILSLVLSCIMLGLGIFNLITSISKEKIDWFGFALSIVIIIISVFPLVSSLKNLKVGGYDAVKEMGVEKSPLEMEFVFKEKRIEVSTTRNGETKLTTIMIKNIYQVKVDGKGLSIYVNNNEMFYIYNEEIVEGSKQRLISLFVNNGVKVK